MDNNYYYNRKLYLFDTFQGFNEKDLQYEKGMSDAKIGDYANTSEYEVLKKMNIRKMLLLKKAIFLIQLKM